MNNFVMKTRKEHKCWRCGVIIPAGSYANFYNTFTGKREYFHANDKDCAPGLEAERKRMRELNEANRNAGVKS